MTTQEIAYQNIEALVREFKDLSVARWLKMNKKG
jgi:hypothetical protein